MVPYCPLPQLSCWVSLVLARGEHATTAVVGGVTAAGGVTTAGVVGLTGVTLGGATGAGAGVELAGGLVTGPTGLAGPTGPTGPTAPPTGGELGGITAGLDGGKVKGGAATAVPATNPEW